VEDPKERTVSSDEGVVIGIDMGRCRLTKRGPEERRVEFWNDGQSSSIITTPTTFGSFRSRVRTTLDGLQRKIDGTAYREETSAYTSLRIPFGQVFWKQKSIFQKKLEKTN